MKWLPSNLREAIYPVIMLYSLMGLTVIEWPLGKRRPLFTLFYILGCITIYILVFKFGSYYANITIFVEPKLYGSLKGIEAILAVTLTYINIFVSASCLITCWYRNKDILIIIRRLNLVDDAIKCLGYKRDYSKKFVSTFGRVTLWFFIILFLILIDVLWLYDVLSAYQLLYCLFVTQLPLHLNAVIDLTFIIVVECLTEELKVVNALTLVASETTSPPLKVKGFEVCNLVLIEEQLNINNYSCSNRKKFLIEILRNLHLEISNIARDLNNIFELQITMEVAAHLAIVTASLYNFYILTTTQTEMFIKIKTALRIFAWCAVYFIRFFRVSSTCAKFSNEALKTSEALLKLNISVAPGSDIESEMNIFFLQMLQCPLHFTTLGSEKIDYTFVRRFIGSVTTYLVILIQMHPKSVTN